MDGLPAGLPGIPPSTSMMTDEQRAEFVREMLTDAERLHNESVQQDKETVGRILSDAEGLFTQLLEEEYNAFQAVMSQADKKLERPMKQHSASVGEYIQQAYDTIRRAGHYPITDITAINQLLAEEYPHVTTVSAMQGKFQRSAGGGENDLQLVRGNSEGTQGLRTGEAAQADGRTKAERSEQIRQINLDRFAAQFGNPGDIRYEIARHGYPAYRYPDDDYVAPEGTVVIPVSADGSGPQGYMYSAGSGGYIPMSSNPDTASFIYIPDECPDGTYAAFDPESGQFVGCMRTDDLPPPEGPPPPPPEQCPPGTFGVWPDCYPSPAPPNPPLPPGPPTPPGPPVPPAPCPPGYVRDIRGQCVPVVQPPPIPPVPPTPGGPCSMPPNTPDFYAPVGHTVLHTGQQRPVAFVRQGTQTPAVSGGVLATAIGTWGDIVRDDTGETVSQWTYTRLALVCQDTPPTPPKPPTPPIDFTQCYRIIPCDATTPQPPTPPTPPKPPAGPQPPEPPKKPEPKAPKEKPIGWDDPSYCASILPAPEPEGPDDSWKDNSWIAYKFTEWADAAAAQAKEAPLIWAWVPKLVELLDRGIAGVGEAFHDVAKDILKTFAWGNQTETTIAIGSALTIGLPTFISKLSGFPVDWFTQSVRYRMQWAHPQLLPSQPSIDALYLFDRIDDEGWECWTRANGNLPNSHRMMRDSQQVRLDVQSVIDLYMRRKISRDELNTELRKRGVLDQAEIQRWLDLRIMLPNPTDLVPFMVRDVANKSIDWGKSDEWFRQNYTGDIKEWGEKLGMDEKLMLYEARKHWQLPSNTLLFEMMARERPGRREDGLQVTHDDAKRLLMQNDMEPSWIEKVLAVSYLPPTRTDIKMGVKTRSIKSIDEAEQLLLDARIDPTYAPTLARILWDDAQRQVANESNLWSRAKVMKEYQDGTIDRATAANYLARFMVDADQIQEQLSDADDKAKTLVKRECIKAVKNRVLRAEVTQAEAAQQLVALGMTEDKASQVAEGFVCYRQSRGTELTIRYLKKIYFQGVLTQEELYVRLLNLRYTEKDSQLLLRSWGIEIQEAQVKEAIKEQKERESALRSSRARYRTEVAWLQKQLDRLEKQQKKEPPARIDAVDTDGRYVPGNPAPPIP